MKKTGFLYDKRYLLHKTGSYHPEVPARLEAIYKGIKEADLLPKLTLINACRAESKWIETVHDKDYINRFEEACLAGNSVFDCPDNPMCSETFETAFLAAGGVIEATKLVMNGDIDNVFCAVRPPGHHAEWDRAMGFCYFNNVAIAAKYAQHEWNIKKVGIVDFDVHHGNGTQHTFESDSSVFYYSIHQHPSYGYPGTGYEHEKGLGDGVGFTLNSPVLPEKDDDEYKKLIQQDLVPAFEKFKPEIIIVSVGFDAHIDDNLSSVNLSTDGFSWIMQKIVEMARQYSNGKLISVLEGGYSLKRLPELAKNHIEILLND